MRTKQQQRKTINTIVFKERNGISHEKVFPDFG